VKEKLRFAIKERLVKQGQINIVIQNLIMSDSFDEETLNDLLDLKAALEIEIHKLTEEFNKYK
jgi:hypothetical protein